MAGDVEVHQAAATVLDHDKDVQEPEGGGHDHHDIAGSDALGVQAPAG